MTYYDYVVLTYWTHFCINTKNEPSLKVHFFVKCQHVKVNQRMSTRESRERSLRQTTFTIFKISKKNYKRDIMQLLSADAAILKKKKKICPQKLKKTTFKTKIHVPKCGL